MRLPFLQMESDLLAHGAPQVAALAGCLPVQALGHIAFLRAWAVAQAGDDAPPDGWARGDDAAAAIEAAAQWGGEPGRLLRALRVAKLVDVTPDGVRVLGLEPYRTAWEKNAKAKERMAKARGRSPNVRASNAESAANFAQQTQTEDVEAEKKPTASQSLPAGAATNGQRTLLEVPPPPEPAKPKRPPNAVAQWHERACKARAEVVGPTAVDATTLRGDQWARLGEALKAHGEKLLDAAFARFLGETYALARDCPMALFVSQVDRWMTEAKASPRHGPETAAQRAGLVGQGETPPGPALDWPAPTKQAAEAWGAVRAAFEPMPYAWQWLGGRCAPLRVDARRLVLGVADRFARDWAEENYGPKLADVVATLGLDGVAWVLHAETRAA